MCIGPEVAPTAAGEQPHLDGGLRGICIEGILISRKDGNMLSRMKTTVDLPDDLFVAAKKLAAELRQPLRLLIERSLRAELKRSGGHERDLKPRAPRWVTVDGGLPPGVDVANRAAMHEWLSRQP